MMTMGASDGNSAGIKSAAMRDEKGSDPFIVRRSDRGGAV